MSNDLLRICKRCRKRKSIFEFGVTNKYYREDGSTINWRRWTCRKCLRGNKI